MYYNTLGNLVRVYDAKEAQRLYLSGLRLLEAEGLGAGHPVYDVIVKNYREVGDDGPRSSRSFNIDDIRVRQRF